MKKLLMLGAILVLGATAFAKEAAPELENQSEAKVTVKARLVAENLVISEKFLKQEIKELQKLKLAIW